MQFLVNFLLCLCLMVSNLQPFSLVFMNINANVERIKAEEAEKAVPEVVVPVQQEEVQEGYNIKLNNTLDLEGYCTIQIPNEYYSVIADETTLTKKVVRYKDNKSRITMSYVTDIDIDADIPGYIVQNCAGLDIVTNSKYDQEYESGTWTLVPATELIDNSNPTVYYITNKNMANNTYTVFWMRVNMYPDQDKEEFDAVLEKIINSYKMYFSGSTVFDTPDTGWYAENEITDITLADTTRYQGNNEENKVYKTYSGFVEDADISTNWRDLEIIIDDHKLQLPCSMQDFYDAGFKINDSKVKEDTMNVSGDNSIRVGMSNSNGTNIIVTYYNDTKGEMKPLKECIATVLEVDMSSFYVAKKTDSDVVSENKIGETEETEGETSETPDETSSEETGSDEKSEETESKEDETSEKKDDSKSEETESDVDNNSSEESETDAAESQGKDGQVDMSKHLIILASGVTTDIYTTDLIGCYGEASSHNKYGSTITYTWSDDLCYMKINIGVVQNIKYITLSSIPLSE